MTGSELARRLRIRAGDRVVMVGDELDLLPLLTPLPERAQIVPPGPATARVVLVGVAALPALPGHIRTGARTLHEHGALWVVWPDGTAGLHHAAVRRAGTLTGLVPGATTRLGSDHAALSFTLDRDDRTFRHPELRI